MSVALTENSSRRPSRPSLANSSSFVGGVRSIAPSLTTSDEPSFSPPPSPPSASPSASNPSSPTYPSSVVTDSSTASRRPHPRHRQQQYVRQQQQQQRNTNMLFLALAAGVERRPSSSSTSSSRQNQHATPAATPRQTPTSGAGFMDRFLKLFPSWTSGSKEENEQKNETESKAIDTSKTTPRSCSIISAASSASMATHSAICESYGKENYLLPRAVSASGAVAAMTQGSKRPHTLSNCSTSSNNAYSGSTSARTPVDEFNSSILEDLFAASQSSSSGSNGSTTANGSVCGKKPSQFLRRKLLWAKHIAGERSARSQDCVTGGIIADTDLVASDGPVWNAIRGRSATVRSGVQSAYGGRNGSAIASNGRCGHRQSESTTEGGRVGIQRMHDATDESDETAEVDKARERLANTWPLSGLHINHGKD